MRTLLLKSRPHHRRRSRSRIEDIKRGRFKMRMHPDRLHGQMRKKLRCVEVGFTYPKTTDLESGASDEDYFNRALLNYEVETEVPFKFRHCWEILKGSSKRMETEIPKFAAKSMEGSGKRYDNTHFIHISICVIDVSLCGVKL
ncbi:hypothetical protein Tco_0509551 [Tanacetum coccineum]